MSSHVRSNPIFLQLCIGVFVWYVLLGSATACRQAREAAAEGPMPRHSQTHSSTIYRRRVAFTYCWTNTGVSLKQQESPVSLFGFILQAADHRKLKQATTLWGYPEFFSVDLAAKDVVEGNQRVNCQIQLALFDCLQMTYQTEVCQYIVKGRKCEM